MDHIKCVGNLIGVSTHKCVGNPIGVSTHKCGLTEDLVHFKLSGYGVMPTRQVNSIQELYRVQALRQTASTEPSVGILVSSAEIDDDDDDITVLQASPGAKLTVNHE